MATNFGKLNFPVSLNPQTAFPLDARSYFESLNEAIAAAATAAPAGDGNATYYFGQTLTVVDFEKSEVDLYTIGIRENEDGTKSGYLIAIGGQELDQNKLITMLKAVLVDSNGNCLLNENNQLNLKTINNQSLLGNGNISISSSGSIEVDGEFNINSDNPIANKVVTAAIKELQRTYRIINNNSAFSQLTETKPGDKVFVKETDELWIRTTGNAWKKIIDQDNVVGLILNEVNFKQMFDDTHFKLDDNNKITLKMAPSIQDGVQQTVSSDTIFDYIEDKIGTIEDVLSEI